MKTFEDLKFGNHPIASNSNLYDNAKWAIMTFENGYGISVIFGKCFYSNGVDTYEADVLFDGEITYNTPVTDDVLGYLKEDQITELMAKIQSL